MASSKLTRQLTDLGAGLCVIGAVAYFGHSAIQGGSGLFVRVAVEKEERRLIAELAEATEERKRLENLSRRLSDEYLDLDLLDERARAVLGFVRTDEVVIR